MRRQCGPRVAREEVANVENRTWVREKEVLPFEPEGKSGGRTRPIGQLLKLEGLITEQQFQDEAERSYKRGHQDAAREQIYNNAPRFQLIDKANSLLKRRHPQAHQKLKNLLTRIL